MFVGEGLCCVYVFVGLWEECKQARSSSDHPAVMILVIVNVTKGTGSSDCSADHPTLEATGYAQAKLAHISMRFTTSRATSLKDEWMDKLGYEHVLFIQI